MNEPGLHIIRSNRTERLLDALSIVVKRPAGSGLPQAVTAAETIVVQSEGMERYVSLGLAERLGVWAHPHFPLPRPYVDRLTRRQGLDAHDIDAWSAPRLTWRIAALLPDLLPDPRFAALRSYLAEDAGNLRRIELSRQIAATFDRYVELRPRMVMGWETGANEGVKRESDAWQPVLWRALSAQLNPAAHFAARAKALALSIHQQPQQSLPERLLLFGISALSPVVLDVIGALSRRVPVVLFLLSPTREHWDLIRSQKEQLRADEGVVDPFEEGHPLLASLGRCGRDFVRILHERFDEASDHELYEEPGADSLLHRTQSDILELVRRGPGAHPAEPLDPADRSIELHASFSLLREVEVLRERLLARLEDDPTLRPRDICVMTPDVEALAPCVEAVFGTEGDIPYRIADRNPRHTNLPAEALQRVVALAQGRLGAPEVMDTLALELVSSRFGLDEADLAGLRAQVEAVAIRWGQDAAHREQTTGSPFAENAWRFGLDRLLLGYAMPGAGDLSTPTFGGALPFDDIEGEAALRVGRLSAFLTAVEALRGQLRQPRPPAAQVALLQSVLGTFVQRTDAVDAPYQTLWEQLLAAEDAAAAVQFTEPVDIRVMTQLLDAVLELDKSASGFLSRGITFSAMRPFRSIPFRVIALVGLSDGVYPRRDSPVGFDLIAAHPLRGDRNTREEDRQLFLESLLAAREALIVTYTGQDIADGARRPPSPVVSELQRCLAEAASLPDEADVAALLTVHHPLQPWSPRHFDGAEPRLASGHPGWLTAAQSARAQRQRERAFVEATLPAVEGELLPIESLIRFFDHPIKALLSERLGVALEERATLLSDREPSAWDGLDRWSIGTQLIAAAAAGLDRDRVCQSLRAMGLLVPGLRGQADLDELWPIASAIAERARPLRQGEPLPPLPVELSIGGRRLVGRLGERWPAGRVEVTYSQGKGRDLLRAWIRHLALCCERQRPGPHRTIGVYRAATEAGAWTLGPVDQPEALLTDLVALYATGMRQPLPFLPDPGFEATSQPTGRQAAVLREQWTPGDYNGDTLAWVRRALGPDDPLAIEIDGQGPLELAERVFGPLRAHLAEHGDTEPS